MKQQSTLQIENFTIAELQNLNCIVQMMISFVMLTPKCNFEVLIKSHILDSLISVEKFKEILNEVSFQIELNFMKQLRGERIIK